MSKLEIAFAVLVFLGAYSYLIYPLILRALLVFVGRRPVSDPGYAPSVTFIITAHNEESSIGEKIENTLALDYPRDRIEILVASDGSTDRTDEIVSEYMDRRVRLIRVEERKGKENAQRRAIGDASGEILVFSDVATRLDPDGVSKIVRGFADPSVGCVSSEDRVIGPDGKVESEGVYVRYEMMLRRLESAVHSVVGLSGSFFAARAEICRNWAPNVPSDFNTVALAARAGLRGISDPDAVGYYGAVKEPSREFNRKVRTVLRGMAALFANRDLINPFRRPLFAFMMVSHKILRWLVPFFLVAAFIVSATGVPRSGFLTGMFIVQALVYLAALSGIVSGRANKILPIRIAAFFVLVNAAIVVAWANFLIGRRMMTWTPSKR